MCKDDWNETHGIPFRVKYDNLYHGNQQLEVELRTHTLEHKDWSDYTMPKQQVHKNFSQRNDQLNFSSCNFLQIQNNELHYPHFFFVLRRGKIQVFLIELLKVMRLNLAI